MEPVRCLFSPTDVKDELPKNPSFEDFQYYDFSVLGKIFALEKVLFPTVFSSKIDEYALLHLHHGFIPYPPKHMKSMEVVPQSIVFSEEYAEDRLHKNLFLYLLEEVGKIKRKVTWIDLYYKLHEFEMNDIDDQVYSHFMEQTEADAETTKVNMISAIYNMIIQSRCLCVSLNNMRLESNVVSNFQDFLIRYPEQASMVTKCLDLDAKKRVEYFDKIVI